MLHYRQGLHRENITVSGVEIAALRSSMLLSQLMAIAVLATWALVVSALLLLPIYYTLGLRIPVQEEILGPDFVEHGIVHEGNRQLLAIIRQKIRFVAEEGMSEAQASAEVVARFAEQQKLREGRKVSLTTVGGPQGANPGFRSASGKCFFLLFRTLNSFSFPFPSVLHLFTTTTTYFTISRRGEDSRPR